MFVIDISAMIELPKNFVAAAVGKELSEYCFKYGIYFNHTSWPFRRSHSEGPGWA